MNMEQERFDDLDQLIDEALHAEPGYAIPDHFTDQVIQKAERGMVWQELLTDFSVKFVLAISALVVFAAIYFFVMIKDISIIQSNLSGSWRVFTMITVVLVFTFFTDQVFLKYLIKKQLKK